MAAVAAAVVSPVNTASNKHNGPRRRKLVGQRRRMEDDGEDDAGPDAVDLVDDDSMTEGSVVSDEHVAADDSDTSNIDEASPTVPSTRKSSGLLGAGGKGGDKRAAAQRRGGVTSNVSAAAAADPTVDVEAKLRALAVSDPVVAPKTDSDVAAAEKTTLSQSLPPTAPAAGAGAGAATVVVKAPQPAIVSSSANQPRRETAYEKQRREHDLYKQKRDEDPSFVPNRGAFFMHDHRGAGPAGNGFRPFGRPGRGRGRGGGFGGQFSPFYGHMQNPADPTVNGPWTHDMHEVVTNPNPQRLVPPRRRFPDTGSQYGGSQAAASAVHIPTCPPSSVPINRSMSVEKPLGTLTVRVFFPPMKEPVLFERFKVVQYTKLPDHRPPLRRDKAVVIDLPGHPKSQIFPAVDRSFIFIPRALRPNQQRTRGNRNRSVMGSISGFSRRTSVFGGSYYNGSMYTPSVALSRRSSIVGPDMGRDYLISPTGSAISRPPLAIDNAARPVVRLPPSVVPAMPPMQMGGPGMPMAGPLSAGPVPAGPVPAMLTGPPAVFVPGSAPPPAYSLPAQQPQPQPQQQQQAPSQSQPQPQPQQTSQVSEVSSLSTVPPPQNHPLPQKPSFHETRPSNTLPMHQPRPQKTVSVQSIESPMTGQLPQQQQQQQQQPPMPFHQQVPVQMANGFPPGPEGHTRRPSFATHSTGTPLSQIPERAIHAAPFQPHQQAQPSPFSQPNTTVAGPAYYGTPTGYPVMQPPPQQGYFYPTPPTYPSSMASSAAAPTFVPGGTLQGPPPPFGQPHPSEMAGTPVNGQQPVPGHNLVAQEVNGMVYYYDPSQMQAMGSYSSYAPAQPPPPPPQGGFMPNMGGMVTPTPADGFYYPPQPGMIYYPQ